MHLGAEYADQFRDRSVGDAYGYRPPYPAEVFDVLAELIVDEPRAVLDIGCGTGEVARRLVGRVDRVDAVDVSSLTLMQGRRLPNGDQPMLMWIHGPVEEVLLRPPYALVTAGQSLHWMTRDAALARVRDALTPLGSLAIVGQDVLPTPWDVELARLISRFSTNRDYRPYDLITGLTERRLFERQGERRTAPVPFVQPVEAYVQSFHSRNGFSRERMGQERAAMFGAAVHRLVLRHCPTSRVELQVVGVVVAGRPGSA